jgi:hypothetical protein
VLRRLPGSAFVSFSRLLRLPELKKK